MENHNLSHVLTKYNHITIQMRWNLVELVYIVVVSYVIEKLVEYIMLVMSGTGGIVLHKLCYKTLKITFQTVI